MNKENMLNEIDEKAMLLYKQITKIWKDVAELENVMCVIFGHNYDEKFKKVHENIYEFKKLINELTKKDETILQYMEIYNKSNPEKKISYPEAEKMIRKEIIGN